MSRFFKMCALFAIVLAAVQVLAAPPKYVFLFIGDGMGPTIRSYYFNQYPDSILEKFPVAVENGTNNYQGTTTDSAASGTAIACSIKTYNGAIGVLPDKRPVTSLAKVFRDKGYAVGIITSVGLNDATPAAHYANRLNRRDAAGTLSDLMASNFDFFAGGALILPKEYSIKDYDKLLTQVKYTLVQSNEYSDKNPTKRVVYIGKMAPDWPAAPQKRHILSDVTGFAAENLAKNPKGFFMMIEGGEIDHRAHNNDLAGTMREMREFDYAIRTALEFAKKHPEETLIVITGDHETGGMTMGFAGSGYAMYVERLALQKGTANKFRHVLKEAKPKTFADVQKHLTDYFGFKFTGNIKEDPMVLTPQQIQTLEEGFKKGNLHNAAKLVMSQKAGIGWTTGSHTALPVLTTSTGVQGERFTGFIDNTDISKKLKELLR